MILRAQGCLAGQLAGDALGSQVEFRSAESIAQQYPDGVRELQDGGTFNTLAGQPTDDSEMALLLARMLARDQTYSAPEALAEYKFWLQSEPFDVGNTIGAALRGNMRPESQANGALMRISPLGIFGANHSLSDVAAWARADAALTHPHPVCQQANALFAMAIAHAISEASTPAALYSSIVQWAKDMGAEPTLQQCIQNAASAPPLDFMHQQGWVLTAFGNALYRLTHSGTLEDAIVDTVMCGGDTDTNAAIAGALTGAVFGVDQVPTRWLRTLQTCEPKSGKSGVFQPRPEIFWPTDVLELAKSVLLAGAS